MLHERMAVTKSSCRNMLIGTAHHSTTVTVRLSYKDVLEAEYVVEMRYETFCLGQVYASFSFSFSFSSIPDSCQ